MYQSPNPVALYPRTLQEVMSSELDGSVLQRGGYDGGAEIGFDGNWLPLDFQALLEKLEAKKNEAIERQADHAEIELAGMPFLVKSKSASGKITYKYVIEGYGLKIYIHNNPTKQIQPVRIRYGSEALIGRDLFTVHAAAVSFLKDLGFTITEEKLSRVDLQIIIERPMTDFMGPILSGQSVRKVKKAAIHLFGERFETYTLGKKDSIQLCIYDKRREILHSDDIKYELMIMHCIGLETYSNPNIPLTRVEFRLGRSALKNLNINTINDLKENESGLVDWLSKDWFRVLDSKKVRGHENSQAMHPLWEEVRAMFAENFPGPDGEKKIMTWRKRERLSCDAAALIKQGLGCLASAMALEHGEHENAGELILHASHAMNDDKKRFLERTNERARTMQILKGVSLNDPRGAIDDDWEEIREKLRKDDLRDEKAA